MEKFTHAHAYREMRTHSVDLYLEIDRPGDPQIHSVASVEMRSEPRNHARAVDHPVPLRLEHDAAQHLIDQLWSLGLRPTHGKASDDLVNALEDSRNDARTTRDRLLHLVEGRIAVETLRRTPDPTTQGLGGPKV